MSLGIPTGGPGVGIRIGNTDYLMTSTIAASKGDLLAVDISEITNDTFTAMTTPGSADDNAETVDACICGVALQDIAAGVKGLFRFTGTVEVMGRGTAESGDLLGPAATKGCVKAATATRGIGWAVGGMADGTISTVLFDGLNGVGSKA